MGLVIELSMRRRQLRCGEAESPDACPPFDSGTTEVIGCDFRGFGTVVLGTQPPYYKEAQAACGEAQVDRIQASACSPSCALSQPASHISAPSWPCVLQPQVAFQAAEIMSSPPQPCPNCPFVNKIHDCCFKPLHFRVVCYAEARGLSMAPH